MFRFPHLPHSLWAGATTLGVVTFVFFLFASAVQAQSVPGLKAPEKPIKPEVPISLRAARGQAPLRKLHDHLKVEASNIKRLPVLRVDERVEETSNKVVRLGVVRSLPKPIHPLSESSVYQVAEGEVRVAGVVSEGALYTRVRFTNMSLPSGARVFVYSLKNPDEFYGPYEGRGLSEDGTFWTPPLKGDGVAIEYFAPLGIVETNDTPFVVAEISHIYRNPLTKQTSGDEAGACNLNVPGDWSEVAKSVGYLEFVSNGAEYSCTGTLLNNDANDQTPYLLTANHCFSTQTSAQSLRVYWNYNSGDTPLGIYPFTDGANLLATGTASDFTFVRLTGSLPGGLYFSGWDGSPPPLSTSVTGLHHPQGSHKRIASGTTNSTCPDGLPGPCSNFTHVGWNAGTTEAGSSGSGLWKGSPQNAQLVGTLTGGSASCENPGGGDHYGNFGITLQSISSYLGSNKADVSITKTTAYDQVAPGSKVVYFITVKNNAGFAANVITVTDNLPAQLTFSSCNVDGGTCSGSGNNRTITVPSLGPGGSVTALIVATVNNSVANGTVVNNTATVSSSSADSNPNNNSSTAPVVVNSTPFVPKSNGKIAYASEGSNSGAFRANGFFSISPNGTNDTLLYSGEPFGSPPAWSPDGTKIAYGRRNTPAIFDSEIYVANANGTGAVKVAGNVTFHNEKIAWSPNGSKLAFIGTDDAIFIANANGTGLSRLLPNTPTGANYLAWSPDGSKLAYSNGWDVFVMGIDGSGQTNLTQNRPRVEGQPVRSIFPRWSPDGTRIVFSAEGDSNTQIFVMNANGSGLAPLITQHRSQYPAWSPDGTKITFVSLNMLYMANSDGTGITQIVNGGIYNWLPDWQALALAGPATIELSANNYNISEAGGRLPITVTRSTSVGTATVDYATSDNAALNACSLVTTFASSRCDYANTVGTLRFASGELSKIIYIPIVDDAHADGLETFTITLSKPTGAALGARTTGTITIQDDALPSSNPIEDPQFFITMQYIDFLGRLPDSTGLANWMTTLTGCPNGGYGEFDNPHCDRVHVSAGFFLSDEFRGRGYWAYRFYEVAFDRRPTYAEFVPDMAKVGGPQSPQSEELSKSAYKDEFVQRSEFTTRYNGLSNEAFVNAIEQNAEIALDNAALTAQLNGGKSRAQLLREIVELKAVEDRFFIRAFVAMQYFGYLRRNPDTIGYNNWVTTLTNNPADFRHMIFGFIYSDEYRTRFGPR